MENMDCFVDTIHMAYRKMNHFHYYWGYMWGLQVNSYLVERLDASLVLVGVHPMVEG
jgi:hypothetical protein